MKILSFIGLMVLNVSISWAQQVPVQTKDSIAIKNYFFAGLSDRIRENYNAAQANYQKVLELDSLNDAAHYELAIIQINQKRLFEAEIHIKKSLRKQPENIWYLRTLSDIYKMNGNNNQLISTLNQLIRLAPQSESYYYDKANAYFLLNQKEEVAQTLQEIVQKFGSSPKLEQTQKQLKTIVQTTKPKDDSKPELNDQLPNTDELIKKVSTVQAFDVLKQVFLNQEIPFAEKLKILLKLQKQAKTEEQFKELAAILDQKTPNDEKLNVLYGDILFQQGEVQKAKEQYQKALKITAQFYIAWEKLLAVQTLLGEFKEAIKTGEEALSYYPSQAILYYYQAFALHRNGQNAEAAFEIRNAQALDSDDPHLNALIAALQAEVWIDQGKFKDAENAFGKAIELSPNNDQIRSSFAYFLALRNHDLVKAEKLALQAITAHPNNVAMLDTYAFILFKQGKYAQALDFSKKLMNTKEQNNPVYLEHYGDILYMNKQKDEALRAWEKAKQAGNDSEKLIRKINEKKYIK